MQYLSTLAIYNWVVVFFFIVLSLVFFYQGWLNLAKNQISKFSWDALMFAYLHLIRGKKYSEKVRKTTLNNKEKMKKLGAGAIFRAAASIVMAIFWYISFLN